MTQDKRPGTDGAFDKFLDLVARLIARAHVRDAHAIRDDSRPRKPARSRRRGRSTKHKEKNLDL